MSVGSRGHAGLVRTTATADRKTVSAKWSERLCTGNEVQQFRVGFNWLVKGHWTLSIHIHKMRWYSKKKIISYSYTKCKIICCRASALFIYLFTVYCMACFLLLIPYPCILRRWQNVEWAVYTSLILLNYVQIHGAKTFKS